MAAMNSSVLACSYAISGTGSSELTLSSRLVSLPSSALTMPVIRAQNVKASDSSEQRNDGSQGRRAALLCLGAALFATATCSANAGPIEDALERSKTNKDLNDQKRLATSGANFYRAYTVQFGSCNFPYNFTGCQDLARQKKVPFISDDIELECKGKDKYKCGSNVFWKW
ncbi:Photosystem I reaction center subunit N, chloroplastic [Heracleum sosnowskyi]|uniref:Photosystem I reaction center subunit N, chloroplastic n=1 Tax=Heracleum sosnowskyi TaxID=360622 RepID=A0AAD8ND50_9APIA|nr:Photosystem I reaction center subunit N, chloroplastic [Heracleum sosnowskyi]